MRRKIFIALGLVGITALALLFFNRHKIDTLWVKIEQSQADIPPPETLVASSSSSVAASLVGEPSASSVAASPTLRAAVNWDVPFTPQAPNGMWEPPFDEACEETSVLMVLRYFRGESTPTPDEAAQSIQSLVLANGALGYGIDTTAEEVRHLLLTQEPSLSAELLYDPTVEELKKELSDGALIIVPAAGRHLGNPYYRPPGPIYHMLVLRGYTNDGYVITNDPGTRHGKEFVYTWDTMLSAIHDWNTGNVEQGQKVVLVVKKG